MNIIKHAGAPKSATLADGRTVVHREERLFVDQWGAFVTCAPYDTHFIYRVPNAPVPRPDATGRCVLCSNPMEICTCQIQEYFCTCGSVAVVAPPSPAGLFVCLFDLNSGLLGYHGTSLYNKKDIAKVAGTKLDTNKIRKELI